MRSFITSSALASLATSVSATGILLPLYVYPAAEYNDNASNWKPVITAVQAHTDIDWNIIINPYNGPGLSGLPGDDDVNVISGVSQLNANDNVNTVGYVRTNYAKSPMDELKANITNYASWASYSDADISIHGIFFDESEADFDYLNEAITFARGAFAEPITTICNFGVKAAEEYYGICDIVVGFESCLNCASAPQYKGQETLDANFPSGYESQGAIIVNSFTGKDYQGNTASAALLTSYAKTISADCIGWYYFCSADYNDITTGPATVGQNADSLASV
ncbi:hypothetical protein AK830_g7145 [Neonectria ditissima]|uniref:Cell surface spherulin 4-like protein n=1 Tax=Neonectria ditissima TaxID=78410 RepID=A0A0P7ANN6_9HYPO|nr:hypothetical protein AK830_g7145 [Neonectria ditissima]